MNMAKHPLEIVANDWTSRSNEFFIDQEVSSDFLELNYKFHFTPVKDYTTPSQVEREKEYSKGNFEFTGTFIDYHELFAEDKLPNKLPEKITFILPKNRKLTDFVGSGFLCSYGFLISQKVLEIILKYNLGNYKTYPVEILHKDQLHTNYYFFAFRNELSDYINFEKSTFFYQKEYLKFESRKQITINSKEDYLKYTEEERDYIHAKLFVFQDKIRPDLFTIDKFVFGDTFISKGLTNELSNCTGLKIEETKRVKLYNS
jgi:hypothetical protein